MSERPQIMVIDDDLTMCNFLREFLSQRGYQALTFCNAEEAVRRYHADRPAAVILDVVIPGRMHGLEALATFKKIDADVPIIVLSGQGGSQTVVQAMKLGALDFVSKPFEADELEGPLRSALRARQLSSEILSPHEQRQLQQTVLLGTSEKMAEVRDLIARVADTDVTVLIRGESGTGKEVVSRTLHAASHRRDKPFVKVNCAALPVELLESELFGFERGAFTGAIQHKPGKFEFANHGTLLLDEIGEMSPALQAKLLQVLQDGEFSRLGGKSDVRVDVRIIAATNRELERTVAEGQFREDLFFRLNVVCITLPPLRQRIDEIPQLTEHFFRKYSAQYHRPYSTLSADTMRMFMEHDWPGNVRELENLIKRAVVLGSEEAVQRELVKARSARAVAAATPDARAGHGNGHGGAPSAVPRRAPAAEPCSLKEVSRTAAREAERELILRTLQITRWNRKETARLLGISYKALLYKIKDSQLDRAS